MENKPNKLGDEKREAFHLYPETIVEYLKCPKCGSNNYVVKSGRELILEKICMEKKET